MATPPSNPFPISPGDNTGGFATNQGGAAFGNPTITRGAAAAGATQVEYPNQAPPKAPAAPVAGQNNVFTGLCEALNQNQQYLVRNGKRQYPDIYEIKFAPASLAAYQVKKPGGGVDITVTAMQNPDSVQKLNTASNSVKPETQSWQVKSGTQIVQVIDQIMRNSTYITDQQLWQYDPVPDPKTGIQQLKRNPSAGTGVTAWYKISVQATQLNYDNVIRDNAYRITFIINTYALGDLHSEYFAPIPYRGVHKSYNYWFTGANTQILNFEQQIDNMYRLAITGIGNTMPQTVTASSRNDYLRDYYQYRKTYMAMSSDRAMGAKGYTNDPGDSAASFLYDLASMVQAKLEIVGDPAWLQQGEVSTKFNWKSFNYNPFNADGGINYDSQQVMFDVSFNQPVDYNFNTGIMNVNASNTPSNGPLGNLPQQNYTYVANRCRSVFSKGSFKQHLEGYLKMEFPPVNKPTTVDSTRTAPATGNTKAAGSRETTRKGINEIQYDAMGIAINGSESSDPSPVQPPATQPAAPPGAPTSTGGVSGAAILNGPPPNAITILPTTPTLNPNATGQTLAPQPTPPQKMNREY